MVSVIVNGFLEILRDPYDKLNITDIILDVNVTDEFYTAHDIDPDEYHENMWEVWVTQNDYDKSQKLVGVTLRNVGEFCPLDGEDKELILQYVKDNALDTRAGFVL
jgi:hypothetical protein